MVEDWAEGLDRRQSQNHGRSGIRSVGKRAESGVVSHPRRSFLMTSLECTAAGSVDQTNEVYQFVTS